MSQRKVTLSHFEPSLPVCMCNTFQETTGRFPDAERSASSFNPKFWRTPHIISFRYDEYPQNHIHRTLVAESIWQMNSWTECLPAQWHTKMFFWNISNVQWNSQTRVDGRLALNSKGKSTLKCCVFAFNYQYFLKKLCMTKSSAW